MAKYKAFTYHVPADHRHAIVIDIKILTQIPSDMPPLINKALFEAKALVDTGASGSCISSRFAEYAELVSFSRRRCRTAQGSHIVPVYRLDVIMPNDVLFMNMAITEFSGIHDFDFIIGMDILSKGDTAITNAYNETVFSFRIPPGESHTDYVNQPPDS